MARGGKRNGAGRKPGSATEKTREIAVRISEEGISPLQVMVEAMRHYYDKGNLDRAAEIAKDCAPYMHPRLGQVQVGGEVTGRLIVQSVHGVAAGEILGSRVLPNGN